MYVHVATKTELRNSVLPLLTIFNLTKFIQQSGLFQHKLKNSPVKQRKATVKVLEGGHFSDSADCAARSGSIVVRKEID